MKKLIVMFLIGAGITARAQEPGPLLERYRAMALSYNHNLKAAEKNIRASLELVKSAKANRGATLQANAHFKYTGNPVQLELNFPSLETPLSFKGSNEQYGAAFSLVQPLYTGGRILQTIQMAGYQQEMASDRKEILRSCVYLQTDVQYWNTVVRNELVEIATQMKNSAQALVKTIRERVEAGITDPRDLLMAQVKLNEAEYFLLQAQSDFTVNRMALNSLIGAGLENTSEVEPVVPVLHLPDSLLQSAGNQRPELRIASGRVKMAEGQLKLNDSKYLPQLAVGAEGSYSAPGYNFQPDLDPNYAVYAKLAVPIFEWGKRRSEKRMYAQEIGMEQDNLNKVADEVALDVATSRTSLLQALERVKLSGASLQNAHENERQAMERYGEGKVSVLEVIDAQAYRQNAQINYAQAKAQAQVYYSGYLKSIHKFE